MSAHIVIEGRLGWGNGDRTPSPSQYDAYGPGGRWTRRKATNGETRGDHLADALAEAGASEGQRLVVVALPPGATDERVRLLLSAVHAHLENAS